MATFNNNPSVQALDPKALSDIFGGSDATATDTTDLPDIVTGTTTNVYIVDEYL